jgi:hypothetical protein
MRDLAHWRANWKFALICNDVLMLGLSHQGADYPIVWLTPSSDGSSSTDERVTLMEIFIDLLGKERINSMTVRNPPSII